MPASAAEVVRTLVQTKLLLVPVAVAALLGAGLVRSSAATGGGATTTRLTVYLVRGERVAPVRRVVPHTSGVARAALAALLRGPTAAERRAGYGTAVPAGTRLLGVSLAAGVATVDLSGRFQSGGGSLSMLLRTAQVVHTATQFPTVERVAFRLDGRRVAAIGGEGVVVAPPVDRSSFEGQAPAILVERPLPGDRTGGRLLVSGTANVFEAQLFVDVLSPSGTTLVHRSVRASAGTGTRGRFAVRVAIPAAVRRATVLAYARSPKNGARIHVVRVPVIRALSAPSGSR